MQRQFNMFTISVLLATGLCAGACDGSNKTIPLDAGVPDPDSQVAENPVDALLRTIGGRAAFEEFASLRYKAVGTTAMGDESPEPGGSMPTGTFERTVSFDGVTDSIRIDHSGTLEFELLTGAPQQFTEVIVGQTGSITMGESAFGFPGHSLQPDRLASTRRRLELVNPMLLFQRVDLDSLRRGPGSDIDGTSHSTFLLGDGPLQLTFVVSPDNKLVQVQTQESHRLHRDVSVVVEYDGWSQVPNSSLWAPSEVQLTVNEITVLQESHTEMTYLPDFEEGFFQLTDDMSIPFNVEAFERGHLSHQWHQAFSALGIPVDGIVRQFEPAEVAPGIFLLAGGLHNSFVIEQENGIVVVDGPIAPEQNEGIIDWINTEFSGKPISHVIPSHFHQDHVAGVRELAGAGAEVVVVDTVTEHWNAILSASSEIIPDRQETMNAATLTSFAGSEGLRLADSSHPVSTLHIPDNAHSKDMVLVTVEDQGATYVFIADLYGPFSGTLIAGGPQDFLRGMQQHGLIDSSCESQSPLWVVGSHGGVETIADSLLSIAQLGIDLSGICL